MSVPVFCVLGAGCGKWLWLLWPPDKAKVQPDQTTMAHRSKSDEPMSTVNPADVLSAGANYGKHPQAFPASAAGNSHRRPTKAAAFQLFPSLQLRHPDRTLSL
jgi:hypothetical protein